MNAKMRSDSPPSPSSPPRVDMARLRALMDGVNVFGFNPETGGRNRPGFSEADMAAREWFAAQMQDDGLRVWRDGAANVFGRFGPADGPCVMAGSHLDTVPEGGAFDGVLGACAALECVRVMRDAGMRPKIAVEVVATSEEEGRFGGMLGSHAFAGMARIGAAIPEIVAKRGSERSRVTIGKAELRPNFPHTIPGAAEFSVVIRDTDESVMRALREEFEGAVDAAARDNGLTAAIEEKSWLSPVALDPELASLLRDRAKALGLPFRTMPSGAGHDAQTMQALCPSALIFVPSRGGISHAPEEHSDWEDIEKGANLLLSALTRLSGADKQGRPRRTEAGA